MSNWNAKFIFLGLIFSATSMPTLAAPSVNDMQACQAMIGFISTKIDAASASYKAEDLAKIQSGLAAYDRYIQEQVITPSLLVFNGNDQAKAATMQKQIDVYKESLKEQLNARYPQPQLLTDYAVAVNDCAKKAMPSGDVLASLTESLQLMIKLAKAK